MMSQLLDAAVFPGTQGGPLEHVIAAKAVAFAEALDDSYPLIETCFGRAVGLVLASNRFASAAAAERAMQAVLRVTATVFGKTRGPHVAGLAHQDGRLFALETEG